MRNIRRGSVIIRTDFRCFRQVITKVEFPMVSRFRNGFRDKFTIHVELWLDWADFWWLEPASRQPEGGPHAQCRQPVYDPGVGVEKVLNWSRDSDEGRPRGEKGNNGGNEGGTTESVGDYAKESGSQAATRSGMRRQYA